VRLLIIPLYYLFWKTQDSLFFVFVFVCVGGTVYYSQAIVVCIMYLMCYIFFVHRLCLYKSFLSFFFFFFPQKKNPTKKIVSHSPFLTKLYNYVVCFVDDDDDDD